jgi:hypothetical protein
VVVVAIAALPQGTQLLTAYSNALTSAEKPQNQREESQASSPKPRPPAATVVADGTTQVGLIGIRNGGVKLPDGINTQDEQL